MSHPARPLPQSNECRQDGSFLYRTYNGEGPFWNWWIWNRGIHREVLQANIQRCLGNEAVCIPGGAMMPEIYLISSVRNFTYEQLQDLYRDSANWERERGNSKTKYIMSRTFRESAQREPASDRSGRQQQTGSDSSTGMTAQVPQPTQQLAPAAPIYHTRRIQDNDSARTDMRDRKDSLQQSPSGPHYTSPGTMQTSNTMESGGRIINASMGMQQNLMNQMNQSSSQPYTYTPSPGSITSASSTTTTGYYPSSYTQPYIPPVKAETYTSSVPSTSIQNHTNPSKVEEDDEDDDEDDEDEDMDDHSSAHPIQHNAASAQYASTYTQNNMQSSAALQQPQTVVAQPQHRPATKEERQWLRSSGYKHNPARNGTEYWLNTSTKELYYMATDNKLYQRQK